MNELRNRKTELAILLLIPLLTLLIGAGIVYSRSIPEAAKTLQKKIASAVKPVKGKTKMVTVNQTELPKVITAGLDDGYTSPYCTPQDPRWRITRGSSTEVASWEKFGDDNRNGWEVDSGGIVSIPSNADTGIHRLDFISEVECEDGFGYWEYHYIFKIINLAAPPAPIVDKQCDNSIDYGPAPDPLTEGAVSYRVELSADGGETWAVVGSVGAGGTGSVEELETNVDYQLRYVAVGEDGESAGPGTPFKLQPPPVVSGLDPDHGCPLTPVTITGNGFMEDGVPRIVNVWFGDIVADWFIVDNDETISTKVPCTEERGFHTVKVATECDTVEGPDFYIGCEECPECPDLVPEPPMPEPLELSSESVKFKAPGPPPPLNVLTYKLYVYNEAMLVYSADAQPGETLTVPLEHTYYAAQWRAIGLEDSRLGPPKVFGYCADCYRPPVPKVVVEGFDFRIYAPDDIPDGWRVDLQMKAPGSDEFVRIAEDVKEGTSLLLSSVVTPVLAGQKYRFRWKPIEIIEV